MDVSKSDILTKLHELEEENARLKALLAKYGIPYEVEKPLCFDPFGQTGFAPVVHNMIAPCKVLV